MKRLRSDMKQNLNDIPTGQIIAVVKKRRWLIFAS